MKKNINWICPICGTKNKYNNCKQCGHIHIVGEKIDKSKIVYPPLEKNKNKRYSLKILITIITLLIIFLGIGYIINNPSMNITNSKISSSKTNPSDSELSLDGITIGFTVEQMHDILGKEDRAVPNKDRVFYHYKRLLIEVKNNKITSFQTKDANVQTKRGIHPNSTFSDVVNKYGGDDYYIRFKYKGNDIGDINSPAYNYEYYFTADDGKQHTISFLVYKDKVQSIFIY